MTYDNLIAFYSSLNRLDASQRRSVTLDVFTAFHWPNAPVLRALPTVPHASGHPVANFVSWSFQNMPWPPRLLLFFFVTFASLRSSLSEINVQNPTSSPKRINVCMSRGVRPSLSLVCFLDEWTPTAPELAAFNRSHVVQLRLKIWSNSSKLTAAHLNGFHRLKSLVVIGTCQDSSLYLNTGFCEDSRGISAVEASAFRGTPQLQRLHLATHPLVRLENLNHLSRLSRLHLQSMNHLDYITRSALDPIRANIEHILLLDNNVGRLEAWMFANMTKLKEFHWSGSFTFVESGCLADLPSLESVALRFRSSSMSFGQSDPTLQPFALARLPHLREFLLHNLDHKDESSRPKSTPPPQPVCNIEGSDIQTVHATYVHVSVLNLCKGIFSCPSCGADPDQRPQRIYLQRIYGSSRSSFTMRDILPLQDDLNVTDLELIATKVDRVTDELGRTPVLRKLRLHRGVYLQMSHSDNQRVGNIKRLTVNPFKFLKNPDFLTSVRIIINICDCVTLEMIEWFKTLALKRSVQAESILLLGCENLKCTCDEEKSDSLPSSDSTMPWQNLQTMIHILQPMCHPEKVSNVSFPDKELMCHAKCTTLKEMSVNAAGATRTISWAWIALSGALSFVWRLSRVS